MIYRGHGAVSDNIHHDGGDGGSHVEDVHGKCAAGAKFNTLTKILTKVLNKIPLKSYDKSHKRRSLYRAPLIGGPQV